ncbi:MAG: AAA family ATPase, partial [Clostridium sp.]|nr:AAA family ATPase [Clostridium sp.]
MSISLDEFQFEQDNLEDVKSWLQQKVTDIEENKEKLKEDINRIKKNTSSYNVELEISKQMYEKVCNDYDKYNEAKDKPYFARIDFKEDLRNTDKYYIGKFGLYDDKREEER